MFLLKKYTNQEIFFNFIFFIDHAHWFDVEQEKAYI